MPDGNVQGRRALAGPGGVEIVFAPRRAAILDADWREPVIGASGHGCPDDKEGAGGVGHDRTPDSGGGWTPCRGAGQPATPPVHGGHTGKPPACAGAAGVVAGPGYERDQRLFPFRTRSAGRTQRKAGSRVGARFRFLGTLNRTRPA